MRRVLLLLAVLTVSLAACSSSGKSSEPTTTTTAPSTTIATVVKESAFVESVDLSARTVTLDPMEFLTGPAATEEFHKENPGATGGPDNDYFIVNPTKDKVVMPLATTTRVQLVQLHGTVENPPGDATLAQLSTYSGLGHSPFWITIERGQVTEVIERFVP